MHTKIIGKYEYDFGIGNRYQVTGEAYLATIILGSVHEIKVVQHAMASVAFGPACRHLRVTAPLLRPKLRVPLPPRTVARKSQIWSRTHRERFRDLAGGPRR